MRDVSGRDLDMSLLGGSVRRVRREARLAIVDVWGVPVRLMTTGGTSTSLTGHCWGLRDATAESTSDYVRRGFCQPFPLPSSASHARAILGLPVVLPDRHPGSVGAGRTS
jgi:hypothetical protein